MSRRVALHVARCVGVGVEDCIGLASVATVRVGYDAGAKATDGGTGVGIAAQLVVCASVVACVRGAQSRMRSGVVGLTRCAGNCGAWRPMIAAEVVVRPSVVT